MKTITIMIITKKTHFPHNLMHRFEEHGIETITVNKIAQAEMYLRDVNKIDAIWIDNYFLSEIESLEFIVKLKGKDSGLCTVPVLLVGTMQDEEKITTYILLESQKFTVQSNDTFDRMLMNIKKQCTNE